MKDVDALGIPSALRATRPSSRREVDRFVCFFRARLPRPDRGSACFCAFARARAAVVGLEFCNM